MKYSFDLTSFADDLLASGISFHEIARQVGLSHTPLYSWASGRNVPSVEVYLRVCAALGIQPVHFVGVEDGATGYHFDTRALHRATRGRSPVACNMRAKWNKGQAKCTRMQTLVRVCRFLDVAPVEFFSAARSDSPA